MKRSLNLLFILMLISQTMFAGIGFTPTVSAEGSKDSVVRDITYTDKNGSTVDVDEYEGDLLIHVEWSAQNKENLIGYTDSFNEIPEQILVDEQSDNLSSGDIELVKFSVSKDKNVKVQFNDDLEVLEDTTVTFKFEGEIKAEEEKETDPKEEDELETDKERAKDDSGSSNTDESTEEDNSPVTLAEEPKEITENIIEDFKLLKEDGSAFEDDELIEVDEDLRFELDWALTNNDHEYQAGDYFKFQLPEQLKVHNKIEDGSLGDYGSFEVDLDGNVTITFNEKIEKESNVKGEFWFGTELLESEIKSTNENLEIIFNDEVAKKITINVKPTSGQAIHKEGQPVDGSFNTEEIEWTVLMNTTRDSLKNAIVNDPILDGQELDLDSLVLEEVEVDLAGEVIENLGEVDFTDNSKSGELNISLGDTNKAYQLMFKTMMTEDEKDNQGTKKYNNTVYLNSDDQTKKQSGASVSVERPKSMEKTSSSFNKGDRSVEWTVNANFNEKNLSAGDEITDEFTFTVGDENFNDVFDIVQEDITIEQVDEFDDEGEPSEKSDATELFDITIDGNKVTYKLKEDSNKAFVINYKTEAKDGTIVNKDGTIVNSVDLNGNTDTSSSGVSQQVGTKTNAGIDYENKTIDWTITINADEQDLKNFILKDDFAGSGQKLVGDSIKISPTNDNASITPNRDLEGFEIDFGDITDSYTITYQTKFTYDFDDNSKPNFKNDVDITYETSDGNDYELEIGDQVNPNKQTKSNGAKNGKANNDTKEITWTVDINYNQLDLTGAEVIDEIADNQSLIYGSVKVYETTIGSGGTVNVGDEVTDNFTTTAEENLVKVDFGDIDQSYRVEFVTKDKDDIYNSDEKYKNTAEFKPGDGKTHELEANITLPKQGKFLGKKGLHNKEDWTIDWEVDVNESRSTITDVTVADDLGSTDAQILLEDSIGVTKKGSDDELVEGTDYNLTVDGNKLTVNFPGEITDHYVIKYSSYIVAEEDIDIKNEAEISSIDETIVGSTEKTETVSLKFSTGGGSGEGETGGLTIDKSESGSDRALEGIEFNLVKTVGSEDIVVRKGKTEADGKLEWKGLKFGDYTLVEILPDGYKAPEGFEEYGEIENGFSKDININSENIDEGIKTLSIENERETGVAEITKVDATTGEKIDGATFTIENLVTGQEYTFTTGEGEDTETGVISEEVPFGEYTVKEITAPEGYRITEDIENITIEIDKTVEVTIENEAIVEVPVTKEWITDEGHELPKSITVKLHADGTEVDNEELIESNDYEYTFKDLDKYDEEGEEIEYTMEEVEIDGYVSEKDGYDLTNIQTVDVSGEKTWDVVDEQHIPDLIIVKLLANDEEVEGKSEEVTKDTDWEFSFDDLPKFDLEGHEIEYTIDEVDVNGYTSEIKDFDITNTQNTTEVSGEKIWQDNEDATGDRPDSINVQVMHGEEVVKDKKVTAKDDWNYTFTDLPTHDKEGKEIEYRVAEKEVPEGYVVELEEVDGEERNNLINTRTGKTEISGEKIWQDNDDATGDRPETITVKLLQNGKKVASQEVTADDNWKYTFENVDQFDNNGVEWGYTVDEEPIEGYEKSAGEGNNLVNTRTGVTEIAGEKIWQDDDTTGDRPDSITVNLLKNGEEIETQEVTPDEDGNWKYSFDDVPRFDDNGVEWGYTVDEEPVEGYEKSAGEGNDLVNTRTGTTEISGTKTWKDEDESARPDSIKVNLLQNDTLFAVDKVTEEDNWEYSFDHLPKYDAEGKAYEYEVTEQDVPGYEATIDGFDLTNTRTDEKSIEITKGWLDDGAQDRPESIEVDLFRFVTDGDKELVDTYEVAAEDDWTLIIEELPTFDDNGKAYTYEIEEKDVKGYQSEIDGFDLTNIRSEAVDVTGTKTWEGDEATNRPESITVELLANGKKIDSVDVTAETDWTYSFEDLPGYDEKGVAIEYTIDEVEVDGYETSINGYDITNTLIPTDPEEESSHSDLGTTGTDSGDGSSLPKTATNAFNIILIGSFLLIVGTGTIIFRRRKTDSN